MDANLIQTISNSLMTNGAKLITLGGAINPYVGGAVTVIIGALLIWLAIKKKTVAFQDGVTQSGQQISTGTAAAQPVQNNVNNAGDNFLDQDQKDKK